MDAFDESTGVRNTALGWEGHFEEAVGARRLRRCELLSLLQHMRGIRVVAGLPAAAYASAPYAMVGLRQVD